MMMKNYEVRTTKSALRSLMKKPCVSKRKNFFFITYYFTFIRITIVTIVAFVYENIKRPARWYNTTYWHILKKSTYSREGIGLRSQRRNICSNYDPSPLDNETFQSCKVSFLFLVSHSCDVQRPPRIE